MEPRDLQFYKMGFICTILFKTDRNGFRIAAIQAYILPAIQLGQVALVADSRGNPVAYATWAYVSDDVLEELSQNPDRILHVSEWNEGDNLCIIDVVALRNSVWRLIREIGRRAGASPKNVYAIRRRGGVPGGRVTSYKIPNHRLEEA